MPSRALAVGSRPLVVRQPVISAVPPSRHARTTIGATIFFSGRMTRHSGGPAGQKKPRRSGVCLKVEVDAVLASEWPAALSGAGRALLGLVDPECPAIHLKAVQGLDRPLGLALRHLDETEAAWPAGFPIVDELDRFHLAVTLEQCFHVLLGGIEGQIAHVDRRHPEVSLRNAHSGEPHEAVACAACSWIS